MCGWCRLLVELVSHMGHESCGSWISSLMGQMGHRSQNVTYCQLWFRPKRGLHRWG